MHIGLDFDNTIACFDRLFHRIAVECGLIPGSVPANKKAVRDFLRACGRESEWTQLQGVVYGPSMAEADLFPGVLEFLAACRAASVPVSIVSHKTRIPASGEPYDLHAAALRWIEARSLLGDGIAGLRRDGIYFEPDRRRKAERIRQLGCTHFIDDLPEFLEEAFLPPDVIWILFDPHDENTSDRIGTFRLRSWPEAAAWLRGSKSHPKIVL